MIIKLKIKEIKKESLKRKKKKYFLQKIKIIKKDIYTWDE